jgi:predicted PurR-regulated permease PerM
MKSLVPPRVRLTLAEKVVRAVVVFGVLAVVYLLVRTLSFLLAPMALAMVVFYSLNPVVNWLESHNLTRRSAVSLCLGGLVLMLLLAASFIWPSLDGWLQEAPVKGERSVFEVQLEARLALWAEIGKSRFPGVDWEDLLQHAHGGLEHFRRRWMETLPVMATEALSSAGIYLVAPVIALFLLLEGSEFQRRLVALVPNRYFETVLLLLHRVDRQIAGYLRGAATQALIISFLTAAVLWGIGMPSAMLFGFIFGIINVIPIVGPILGASAGLLYALMDPSAPSVPVLVSSYFGIHVVDVAVITPWVVGRTLDLHPLLVIVGLTVGGTLGGILGMLLSIPLLAVAKAIVSTLYDAYLNEQLG